MLYYKDLPQNIKNKIKEPKKPKFKKLLQPYIFSFQKDNTIDPNNYSIIYYDPNKDVCIIDYLFYKHLNDILISIFTKFNEKTLVCTHIPFDLNNFSELRDIFLKAGFNSPYVSNIEIIDGKIDPSVFLIKNNIPNGNWTPEMTIKKIDYAINQYRLGEKQCFLHAKLSQNAISFLEKSWKIGHVLESNGKHTQRELTGELYVSDIIYHDKKHIYIIDIDRNSIKKGKEEEVSVSPTRYNFHSHPKDAYINYNVSYAWPSLTDYLGYLKLGNKTIFHCVASLEGLYVISFSKYWCSRIDDKRLKKFINKKYDIDIVKKEYNPESYIAYVNNQIKLDDHKIFDVKFFKWEKSSDIFEVFYAKNGVSCLPSQDIVEKYSRIHEK